MTRQRGFTLIELMIVVVIIAILSAIAYPAYTRYVYKSRRADAYAALNQDQAIMERCYAQYFSYTPNPACPALSSLSPQNFYRIATSNLTATTYTLTATPQGAQAGDTQCTSLSLDQAGNKTSTGPGSNCWGS